MEKRRVAKSPGIPVGFQRTGGEYLTHAGAVRLGKMIEDAWARVGIILTPRKVRAIGTPRGDGSMSIHVVEMSDFLNGYPMPHAIAERLR